MNAFVESNPFTFVETSVPVLDGLDVLDQLAVYPTLFARLAHRGDFRVLVLLDEPLRKLPSVVAADRNDHDVDTLVISPVHDATGGYLLPHRQLHAVTPASLRCHTATFSSTSRVSIRAIRPGRFSIEIG